MAKRSTVTMTCDRCGGSDEILQPHDQWYWGIAAYVQWNGLLNTHRSWPTRSEDAKDLCPACMKELDNWWRAGAPEEQYRD